MNLLQLNKRLAYNPKLVERTKDLRKKMTEHEKKLWFGFLRKVSNLKFRVYRQRTIDNFIVDFYIPKLKLVIEIDGESHFTEVGIEYDVERNYVLNGMNLRVIRFTNLEVMKNFEGVCKKLEKEFNI